MYIVWPISTAVNHHKNRGLPVVLNIVQRDLQHIWHPCAQMKDYEAFPPLEIIKAEGAYLYLKNGQKVIDATSSWWSKSLGHQHPRLRAALLRQANQFEHVMFAHTTHETIVALSEKLTALNPILNKVFYAGDGSCAVEIALKMSLHSRVMSGEKQRTKFIALANGYHGETTGAMSVSDLGIYRDPYRAMLFDVATITPVYVNDTTDSLWNDCESYWMQIEGQLKVIAETATAIIVEPIVQGAGGMKMYSQDFLRRVRAWAAQHNVHLIADECMTGIGRTGKMLACEHAGITPDFICLSKGLTSGWLPFSAVLTSQKIYDLFYDDYAAGKSFLHSHTHSGNALAASVALETLNIIEKQSLCERATLIGDEMRTMMQEIADSTGRLRNVRGIGAFVAADLIDDVSARAGFDIYKRAVKYGALLRPLGNTLYWMMPLNVEKNVLLELKKITQQVLNE